MLDTAYRVCGCLSAQDQSTMTWPSDEEDAASTTVRFRSLDGRDREIAVPRLTFTKPITTLAGAST
jgi:hypothetical protein